MSAPNKQLVLSNGAQPRNPRTDNGAHTIATRKPRKMGRRSLYTPAMQRRICKLLAKGNTIIATCDRVGITTTTFHQWCEDKPDFSSATSRARGQARIKLVKIVTDASKIDWRAAGWLLSHCWPHEYSEQTRSEVALLGGIVLLPAKEKEPE